MNGIDEAYFFGDSYTDGGLGAHGIFELSGHTNPPSPPYYRGQWCDGPTWVERFAEKLGARYVPSHNYATGGATTGLLNVAGVGYGMLAQVQRHIASNPHAGPLALHTLWAGGNDFNDGRMPRDEVVPRAIANIEECIRLLSGAGARSILVVTYPNAGYTPLARMQGIAGVWDRLSRELATSIVTLVMKLRGQLSATLILGDVFKLHEAVIDYPEEYGFTNITDSCLSSAIGQVVGDPSETLYWDDAHFTAAFHALVADRLYHAVREGLG